MEKMFNHRGGYATYFCPSKTTKLIDILENYLFGDLAKCTSEMKSCRNYWNESKHLWWKLTYSQTEKKHYHLLKRKIGTFCYFCTCCLKSHLSEEMISCKWCISTTVQEWSSPSKLLFAGSANVNRVGSLINGMTLVEASQRGEGLSI